MEISANKFLIICFGFIVLVRKVDTECVPNVMVLGGASLMGSLTIYFPQLNTYHQELQGKHLQSLL